MSKEINIARNISQLRKKHNITQEQLADAIKVSPQAVSKWETASCQPDTLTLPLIADYFHVSIDYLFYGCEETRDDIYEQITNRVVAKKAGTEEPFDEALKLSSVAQHGILFGYESDPEWSKRNGKSPVITKDPLHLLDAHGFSISSPKGFSAIVTDDFLNSIDGQTMKRVKRILEALADEDCLRVTTEILNFHGISFPELKDKTKLDEERLRTAIEAGKKAGFIEEKMSYHAILGTEYFIQRHHYNCLCLILSSVKMIEVSLRGCSRLMRHTKLSIGSGGGDEEPSSTTDRPSSHPQ